MQGYALAEIRFRRKKAPSWLSRMSSLLECGDGPRTNLRASKKQRQIIRGTWARGQSTSVDRLYVCSFWGEEQHLNRFLQLYAVEKAKLEARTKGYAVSEQALADGSIKLSIHEGA